MNSGSYIEVNTSTWSRDTHGLFDYETKIVQKRSFRVAETSNIYRIKEDCYIQERDIITGSTPLINIEKKGSDYQVSLLSEDYYNKMWLVVKEIKSTKPKGYKLSEGDWLKLGRVKLRVQKIVLNPLKTPENHFPDFFKDNEVDDFNERPLSEDGEGNKENPCRICLSDAFTQLDPLICPCRCAGTMKYIHLNCLKVWLNSKVSSRLSERGMSFYLKDLTCELCKFNLPPFITQNNQKINLLTMSYPTKSYIVLEEYKPDKNKRLGLHFVSLNENETGSIGRGHDCDIKITDISVSRRHCKLQFLNSEFFIQDSKSKFGTLAKIKKSFMFRYNYDITIQVSRTVIRLVYKTPFSCKNVCSCLKTNKIINANLSYLTQPECQESDSEPISYLPSSRHMQIDDSNE